jgi:hypothetical protein
MDRNLRDPIRATMASVVGPFRPRSALGVLAPRSNRSSPRRRLQQECVDAYVDERHRSSPFGLVFFGTNRGSLPKEPLYKAF